MKFSIQTYNNGVGIVTDAVLLKNLITAHISSDVIIQYIDNPMFTPADIGIWIQNYDPNKLHYFKQNIFFINEEWASINELHNFSKFTTVVCKSTYAYKLLSNYGSNLICLPFISPNYHNPNIAITHSFLHFAGRSIQKNTELILQQNIPLTLIDPYKRYAVSNTINHINTYQTSPQINTLLNSHQTHICISLYESWGHYMFEGLSTGAEIICSDIPVFKEQLDPNLVTFIPSELKTTSNYMYDTDNIDHRFPVRKSFHITNEALSNTLNSFTPNNKRTERIKLFRNIVEKNAINLIQFFKSF